MKPMHVGLLGIGTVGGGTYAVLKRNADEIARRAGRPIEITVVADKNLELARKVMPTRHQKATETLGAGKYVERKKYHHFCAHRVASAPGRKPFSGGTKMLREICNLLRRAWKKYCDFIRESGLDEGNCRRCVPIIRHDPPLETGCKWLSGERPDQTPKE